MSVAAETARGLPEHLEPVADLFTLTAQGRIGTDAVRAVFAANGGAWDTTRARRALDAALGYLRAWESFYDPLMTGPCPARECTPAELCPWHRQTLRRWLNRLHPVVRAAADPDTFAQATAALVTDLPSTDVKRSV